MITRRRHDTRLDEWTKPPAQNDGVHGTTRRNKREDQRFEVWGRVETPMCPHCADYHLLTGPCRLQEYISTGQTGAKGVALDKRHTLPVSEYELIPWSL